MTAALNNPAPAVSDRGLVPGFLRLLRANGLLAIASFLSSVLLARALAPEGRGDLANFLLWPMILSHLAMCGLHLSLARRIARDTQSALIRYRQAYRLLALPALTAIGLLVVIEVALLGRGESAHGVTLGLGALIVVASMWNTLQVQMELGRYSLRTYTWARGSFGFLYLAFIGALWIGGAVAPIAYAAAFASAAIISACFTQVLVRASLKGGAGRKDEPLEHWRQTLREAAPFALSTGVITLSTMADRVAVSTFFDSRTMGLYVIAVAMAQLQTVINEAMSPLFFAKVSQGHSISDTSSEWLASRLRLSILINALIGALLVAMTPFLLPIIYGSAYASAVAIVYILVPAMALRGMMRPFEEVLKGSALPMRQSLAVSVMSVIMVAGSALAVQFELVVGIPLALLVGTAAGLALIVGAVAKAANLSPWALVVPRASDLALITDRIGSMLRRAGVK